MPLAAFPKCYLPAMLDGRMSVRDWLDLAAEHLEVDGLELYWPTLRDLSDSSLQLISDRALSAGFAVPMLCASPDFTLEEGEKRDDEIADYQRAIAVGARLGCRFVRLLSGQARPGLAVAEGIRRVVAGVEQCLPVAAAHDVTLVLENHYKDGLWQYPEFALPPAVFFVLLDALPADTRLAINFDPSNALVAGVDPTWFLDQVLVRVKTMHASDRWRRSGAGGADLIHGVIGEGAVDYDAIFARLAGQGFQGWISIEDGNDPAVGIDHLRRSVSFLRRKMKEHGLP